MLTELWRACYGGRPVTPTGASRKNAQSRTVKLDIASRFEMLEMVDTVLAHLSGTRHFGRICCHARDASLDQLALHLPGEPAGMPWLDCHHRAATQVDQIEEVVERPGVES